MYTDKDDWKDVNFDQIVSIVKESKAKIDEIKQRDDYIDCLLLTTNEYRELQSQIDDNCYHALKPIGIMVYVGDASHYDSLKVSLKNKYEKVGIISED